MQGLLHLDKVKRCNYVEAHPEYVAKLKENIDNRKIPDGKIFDKTIQDFISQHDGDVYDLVLAFYAFQNLGHNDLFVALDFCSKQMMTHGRLVVIENLP